MTVRLGGQFRDVQSSRGDSERVIATAFPDQCARATCSCGGEGPGTNPQTETDMFIIS